MIDRKRIIAAALVGVMAVVAIADETADFKKWYAAQMPNAVKAFKTKNLKYFEACSTADFVYMMGGQKQNKKQAMAGMQQMFSMAETIDAKFAVKTLKANGGKAVVEMTSTYKLNMKPGPDKKKHVLDVTSHERETWVKKGNTWMLKMMEEVKPSTYKMDGKPFNPAQMAPPQEKKSGGGN